MDSIEKYYSIEKITNNIQLCFVDINLFVKRYFFDIIPDNFRREKSIYFEPDGILRAYFQADDFEKINRFKVLKKQVEWMAGKIAVKKLVALHLKVKENEIKISAKKSGAPFLDDFPQITISISHSGSFAVAAIGFNKQIVAVDIEKIEKGRMQNIGKIAFSNRELKELLDKSDEKHYLFWTVKEAFLKYIEKGFAEGLKKVEFLDGLIFHNEKRVENIIIDSKIIDDEYAFTLIHQ